MAERASALLTPTALAERLPKVVLLDVQYALSGTPGRVRYASAHLPGARFLDLDTVLADPPGDGGRHPLPTTDRLETGLRALGVDDASRVVVYDQQSSLSAARAWWVLRWAGIADVRVLDGGLDAWVRSGEPTTAEVPPPAEGTVSVKPGALPVLDVGEVAGFIAAGGVLLDARTGERFRGEVEPIDTEAGHIPGSRSLPIAEVLRPDGRFGPPEAVRSALAAHGIPTDRQIATSCGSGVTACQLTLALHEAGVDSTPFIGSWSDWIRDPLRPRATGAA